MLQDEPLVKSASVAIQRLDANKLNSGPELSEIEFDSVNFAYPINKDRKVLRNFEMKVGAGLQIALVGHSGKELNAAVSN
jgi:ABC-type multidrug transport system fused ATPase/permease subunit